jgi:nicotinamide riboside kinase
MAPQKILRISNRKCSSFKKRDDFHIIGKEILKKLKRAYTYIASLDRDYKDKGISDLKRTIVKSEYTFEFFDNKENEDRALQNGTYDDFMASKER